MSMLDVLRIVQEESGNPEVTLATRLDALQIDSLEFVALLHEIEGKLSIVIPDEDVAKMETVSDLAAVAQRLAA